MRPRFYHAAVLAAVGWYLMVPQVHGNLIGPLGEGNNGPSDFSQWNNEGSYDTAAECEDAHHRIASLDPKSVHLDTQTLADLQRFALCISTDDPRLKAR